MPVPSLPEGWKRQQLLAMRSPSTRPAAACRARANTAAANAFPSPVSPVAFRQLQQPARSRRASLPRFERVHSVNTAIGQVCGMAGRSGGRAGKLERAGERASRRAGVPAGGAVNAGEREIERERERERAGGRPWAWAGGRIGWFEGQRWGKRACQASGHPVQGAIRHAGGRADGRAVARWVWRAVGWLPARGDIPLPAFASACHAPSARHREIRRAGEQSRG